MIVFLVNSSMVSSRKGRDRLAVIKSGSRATSKLLCRSATFSYLIWILLQVTEMPRGLCACEAGLNNFMNDWINTSMKHPAARHASKAKSKTGPRCPHCSRRCASDFGLRSHLHFHASTRPNNSNNAMSSSIQRDFSSSSNMKCIRSHLMMLYYTNFPFCSNALCSQFTV